MPVVAPPPADATVVEVFHPYRAQEKHQLTIAVGEKLNVVEKDPSGWWVGRNAKGVMGVFPSTYTRKATTTAPSAEVAREVISARLLSELGIIDDTSAQSFNLSNGLVPMDLDYDEVYAMTDRELERDIRRLVAQLEQTKKKFVVTLDEVVDQFVEQRKKGADPSMESGAQGESNAAFELDKSQLKFGKRRMEELISSERALRDELEEWIRSMKSCSIPIPAVLATPQPSILGIDDPSRAASGAVTPVSHQPGAQAELSIPPPIDAAAGNSALESSSTAASEDDAWLSGVSDSSLIPYLRHLHKELIRINDDLDVMENEMQPLAVSVATLESEVQTKQERLNELADSHQERVRELFEMYEKRVEAAQKEYAELKSGGKTGPQLVQSLTEQIELLEKQVEAGKQQYKKVEAELVTLRAKWASIQAMSELTTANDALSLEVQQLTLREKQLRDEAVSIEASAKAAMQEDQLQYRKLERRRREVYNQIQELKGNLRVYCRIKPRSSSDKSANVEAVDDMTVRITDPETEQVSEYEFDFVIPEKATQEEIFEEVRPLATSVLDGYNVCIFAYGQTGSGKTYTMEGPPDNRGINFRAVKELFQIARDRGSDYRCTMRVSILEVYNDKLFDLQNKRTQCKVRWGGDEQGVVIEPIVKHVVHSVDDVQNALEKAYQSRSVAGTDCNAHSSRSHCILTVYVDATNCASEQTILAKLHLIDLAGSERVKNSGVEGDRLKEATHINTSLTHLKTVIQGLANKTSFVAYRNSTLTSMLQDSLGGNCKCLMFANVSPAAHNVPESVCTMKYAAEARKVEVGKVSANVKKR